MLTHSTKKGSLSNGARWLVERSDNRWDECSASFILKQFEQGHLSENTLLKVTQLSSPKPLKQYIRELVWSSHKEELTLQHPLLPHFVW